MMKDELMVQRAFVLIIFLLGSLFLPGCVKYYELMKSEVPQGRNRPEHREMSLAHLRSCTIYDQFKTQALFDVLWLSDRLKTTYVNMVSARYGKDDQAREALLRRQLEESNHWITFIVLAEVRDTSAVVLGEKDSAWTLFLQASDGEKVQPVSIKEIELEPEYQLMFGSRFNQFKKVYLVKFPAKPLDGERYLERGPLFSMTIASVRKMESVSWERDVVVAKGREMTDEDLYWG